MRGKVTRGSGTVEVICDFDKGKFTGKKHICKNNMIGSEWVISQSKIGILHHWRNFDIKMSRASDHRKGRGQSDHPLIFIGFDHAFCILKKTICLSGRNRCCNRRGGTASLKFLRVTDNGMLY